MTTALTINQPHCETCGACTYSVRLYGARPLSAAHAIAGVLEDARPSFGRARALFASILRPLWPGGAR